MAEKVKIHIPDDESVWFVEKQVNVFDFLDFFPTDAVGTNEKEGKLLKIDTDLGWSFETDIEPGKFCFRKKSKSMNGTGKWVKEVGLKKNDTIFIEKISSYHYKIYKE